MNNKATIIFTVLAEDPFIISKVLKYWMLFSAFPKKQLVGMPYDGVLSLPGVWGSSAWKKVSAQALGILTMLRNPALEYTPILNSLHPKAASAQIQV